LPVRGADDEKRAVEMAGRVVFANSPDAPLLPEGLESRRQDGRYDRHPGAAVEESFRFPLAHVAPSDDQAQPVLQVQIDGIILHLFVFSI
jgi:hypothetical protein